jgi:low affinity Fe/Cu permease
MAIDRGRNWIERFIGRFANALSTTIGFSVVNVVMAVGLVLNWLDVLHDDAYTLALSIAAITITNAVLVAQRRDTEALHAKLDELVRSSDARNDVIGIEKDE